MAASAAALDHARGPSRWRRQVRRAGRALFVRVWLRWRPPEQVGTREWADANLWLPPDIGTARPGKYRPEVTPWLYEIQDAVDDPAVAELVCMKSSQVAWTIGVVTAYIGKRIAVDPCPIVVMFPTTESAREYSDEKFIPIVDATPALRQRIDRRSRKSGNRATFKKFVAGFLKLVGSNSPRAVKSSSAPVIVVEEPDDASTNVKGQGDSITLLRDRAKTHARYKFIMGGTPTIADLSAIEFAYKRSDQRKLFVPCHHCGVEHVLSWDNVRWDENAEPHELYGRAEPETAAYYCPHCAGQWTDYDKNENVTRATWRATAPFNGVAGFGYLSELYVPWPRSALQYLVRRYLEAKHEADQGDDEKLIAFHNSTLGVPYEYGGERVDLQALMERALPYPERSVPAGAVALTVGIDVQHDRFAVIVRAWGRGEESWLVYWGEIYAAVAVTDRSDDVWSELEQLVFGTFEHASGRQIHAEAVTIDSGDGDTTEQVYDWVRSMRRKYPRIKLMAGKGASETTDKEIFSLPKSSIDHRSPTKAARYGLRVYLVGTNRAKDLVLGSERQRGRIYLAGEGPGRFHVYEGARADYWDQVVNSEVKAPARRMRGRLVWQKRAGRRNEALDCEIYALHAARALRLHVLTPAQWDERERRLLQADLFTAVAAPAPSPAVPLTVAAPQPPTPAPATPAAAHFPQPTQVDDPWMQQ